ncbi:MAG TPA: cellulase family glycosylhydrolase [Chloroflexota bacterium]|nr:cellulase family glycosylhydrolase [Chloroflexota bacterium]
MTSFPIIRSVVLGGTLAVAVVLALVPQTSIQTQAQTDARFFSETSYRIGNDKFWDFFQHRGGTRTFGFPVSREFSFRGQLVQFFQRGVLQDSPNGVQIMNILDDGLLPYTHVNGSTFPAASATVVKETPPPGSPDYANAITEYTRKVAPDTWEGLPVNFFQTFSKTVSYTDAFPNRDGPESLLPLLNLELWGAPTSEPARDPKNNNFVYQRFQRRIAHYDDTCKCTQGALLGDILKSLITGENLPVDLEQEAKDSPLLRQYDSSSSKSIKRPNVKEMDGTDMTNAFVNDKPSPGGGTTAGTNTDVAQPSATAEPSSGNRRSSSSNNSSSRTVRSEPYKAQSPEYGMNVFLWGHESTTERDLNNVKRANFGWQKTLFQWRLIEPAQKGVYDWSEADRVVAASTKAGIKTIARVDFQPDWARSSPHQNGPPDRYEDYADFVKALANRYKAGSSFGEISAIEIWNEPNLDREWGGAVINQASAQDYVRLLRLAYTAVKEADPTVTVISAGMSPTCTDTEQARPDDKYIQWMYEAGAKPYFDVLGAHGAGYDKPPSASTQESIDKNNGCGVFTFRRIEDLRNVMVKNGDGDKQIWLLEFGWTTDKVHPEYSWFAVSPETHAQYLVDAYLWAKNNWSPWIGVMTLWNMADANWGPDREELWWSITNPDGSPRPAYTQLQQARRDGPLK